MNFVRVKRWHYSKYFVFPADNEVLITNLTADKGEVIIHLNKTVGHGNWHDLRDAEIVKIKEKHAQIVDVHIPRPNY